MYYRLGKIVLLQRSSVDVKRHIKPEYGKVLDIEVILTTQVPKSYKKHLKRGRECESILCFFIGSLHLGMVYL